uniref:Uncharacterized protein n=2 Tax=Oryza TaxID=4527 RepID=A0A0E0MSW3_ORYRU
MGLKPTWPIVGWLLPLPQEPRDEAQFEIPLGRIHLLRRAADHHGRPRRRGLLQAPPLPLLRRRRSDLHQGHQHVPRLRAQAGGLRRGRRSGGGGGSGRPRSGDRREALRRPRLRWLGILG